MKKSSSVSDLMALLKEGVEAMGDDKAFRKYLQVMSRFSTYSSHNVMLIYSQCPEATFVAGYQAWKTKFHRHVKKGEKAIRILAPRTIKKTDDQGETLVTTTFAPVRVFDISQTEGEPLPSLSPLPTLEGDVENYLSLIDALESVCPFRIVFQDLEEGVNGKAVYQDHSIHIQSGLSQKQTIKTLLHEIAHTMLHNPSQQITSPFVRQVLSDAALREMEAESVAFVVSSRFGLDVSDYSFAYVCRWKMKRDFPQESLKRIASTSSRLIAMLEGYFDARSRISSTGILCDPGSLPVSLQKSAALQPVLSV